MNPDSFNNIPPKATAHSNPNSPSTPHQRANGSGLEKLVQLPSLAAQFQMEDFPPPPQHPNPALASSLHLPLPLPLPILQPHLASSPTMPLAIPLSQTPPPGSQRQTMQEFHLPPLSNRVSPPMSYNQYSPLNPLHSPLHLHLPPHPQNTYINISNQNCDKEAITSIQTGSSSVNGDSELNIHPAIEVQCRNSNLDVISTSPLLSQREKNSFNNQIQLCTAQDLKTASDKAVVLKTEDVPPKPSPGPIKRKLESTTDSAADAAVSVTVPTSKKSKVGTTNTSAPKVRKRRSPKKIAPPKISEEKKVEIHDSVSSATSDEIDSESYLCKNKDGGDKIQDEIVSSEIYDYMMQIYKRQKKILSDYEEKCKAKMLKYRKYQLPRLQRKVKELAMGHAIVKKDQITTKNAIANSKSKKKSGKAEELREKKAEEHRKRVWLSIVRKSIPKVTRVIAQSHVHKMTNHRRISHLCAREVRRTAVLQTNMDQSTSVANSKILKEIPIKARRLTREMLLFWKKNEKEEREKRKRAEKENLEKQRVEEELREAKRQARKLNFLITQTELYSHFVSKKTGQGVEEAKEFNVKDDEINLSEPMDGPFDLSTLNFDDATDEQLKDQARRNVASALQAQKNHTQEFDESVRGDRLEISSEHDVDMNQIDQMSFLNPSSMPTSLEIPQPKLLTCSLKPYQMKGLSWLANLYEQGINGILADEMGLGKTVQSISVMAYLAEAQNIWGPFLVVAPASTLHNWQQEITKFTPELKVLPYWGNLKDRKVLRKFWNKKHMYTKEAPFHVVITSYQLAVSDEKYFQRVRWQYMILDEAHAIKSSTSARWKTLLNFHCRNRLLLTGTPIQNSMQELWALLHFIMPSLFDSHEEFSEWFSKDIESHAENKGSLNEHQLKRLHMILKPFMLRRIKKDVENELGEKIEVTLDCYLTARQKRMYKALREKISISELLEKASSLNENESMDSLMNLVMQFRKVCNHPELFERAQASSSFAFIESKSVLLSAREGAFPFIPYATQNCIKFKIPKRLYREGLLHVSVCLENDWSSRQHTCYQLFNIYREDRIHSSLYSDSNTDKIRTFSFIKFSGLSIGEASASFRANFMSKLIHILTSDEILRRRLFYKNYDADLINNAMLLMSSKNYSLRNGTKNMRVLVDIPHHWKEASTLDTMKQLYMPSCMAPPIEFECSDRCFTYMQINALFPTDLRRLLYSPISDLSLVGIYRHLKSLKPEADFNNDSHPMIEDEYLSTTFSNIRIPAMKQLIMDSGKLAVLDALLPKMKLEGHRILIYFQMTKMIDLMEEYLNFRGYVYLRLDGSTTISDRRDMVTDWQTRPDIFIFLLSTRAGGLGINLTAADTVIFYDSDWNPTVDQQAMDRAHRLGQTRQVTVYRLITKGTIDERILQRAKKKDEIHRVVISGGEFRQVDFKPREIVSLLLDDEELEDKLREQQLKRREEEEERSRRGKLSKRRGKQPNAASPPPGGRGESPSSHLSGASTPGKKRGPRKRGVGSNNNSIPTNPSKLGSFVTTQESFLLESEEAGTSPIGTPSTIRSKDDDMEIDGE